MTGLSPWRPGGWQAPAWPLGRRGGAETWHQREGWVCRVGSGQVRCKGISNERSSSRRCIINTMAAHYVGYKACTADPHRLVGGAGGTLRVSAVSAMLLFPLGDAGRLTGEGGGRGSGDAGGGRGRGGMGGKGAGYTRSAVSLLSRVTVSLEASHWRSSLPPERSQKRHGTR